MITLVLSIRMLQLRASFAAKLLNLNSYLNIINNNIEFRQEINKDQLMKSDM